MLISLPVAADLALSQAPLFLTQSAKPIVMLNVSNDHQLFFKAYDDFSDLDHDGIPETTYKHSFDYYGYFDSYKCYTYGSGVFSPASTTADKYCSSQWSGNFLNWASMTRIDTIRKILYGGMRSTDSSTETVLQRAYLPNDAHSFAKFYSGNDLTQLTPFTSTEVASGITLCNTTVNNDNALSQNVTNVPLIRVAKGNYSLWAANERWQCRWSGEKSDGNGNVSASSGISASSSNPSESTHGLGSKNYTARVKACVSNLVGTENCKTYTSSNKPIGLLQTYGDDDKVRFGLLTGSYAKNKSGGVLRKNVGSMSDEINISTDGTFKTAPAAGGIINTLNRLRIYGYRHEDGTYHSATNSDNCIWGINTFTNGNCSNWGNPQSEIFLESLRYLAGKTVSTAFSANDTSKIANLTTATWSDPIATDQWCAKINTIQFNASTSSYDADELSGAADIGLSDLNGKTDFIGGANGEAIHGNAYFVGENGTDNNQLCTAKSVSALSSVRGTCPDAPRLSGSYQIAGLAHHAKTNSIRTDRTGDQLVTTYGVALSPGTPKVVIPVPGDAGKKITILPACRNSSVGGNCAIVDFKIISQTVTSTTASGSLYVNWEDSEQGGDFDQDMWGVINYSATASQITVTTDAIAQSTPYAMGFGYIINGTTKDGFHAHSGINNYAFTDPTSVTGCVNCAVGDAATGVTYDIGTSDADSLEQPLWYAAKWGGFDDGNDNDRPDQLSEWDKDNNGLPDRYFFATNPAELATSLGNAMADVIATAGSSASVATNSTRLDTNTVIYQAKFNSSDWTGQLLAFTVNANGSIATLPSWDAGQKVTTQGADGRSIFSYNPTATTRGIAFAHSNLNTAQQGLINEAQLNYIRGDQSNEQPGGTFRKRSGTNALLGDLINSDPWFIGRNDFGYGLLAGTEGSSYLDYRASTGYQARTPLVAVGGNDGMLHVFNANISGTGAGQEVFAYVPHTLLSKLPALTLPSYNNSGNHQYYVDGSPIAADAYFDTNADTVKEWRTALVGTLAAGGKGVFALDVTFLNTSNVAETAFSGQRVLWEINNQSAPVATDLTDDLSGNPKRYGFTNHLGHTYGQASIVRMANGEFAAVFGNGYNSVNHKAVLYIVNIGTGALIKSITTGEGDSGNPNGLSTPIAIDINGDRIVDAIYAGDLRGNMWKFDVSNSNPGSWDVAFKSGSTPKPLFTAKNASNQTQPITAKPQVGKHPNGGVMVYFGTGKFFEVGDNSAASPQTQSFYGIRDTCVKAAGDTSNCSGSDPAISTGSNRDTNLQKQSIIAEGSFGDFDVRVTSAAVTNKTTFYSNKKGWYMDLLTPPLPGTGVGERIVSQALLRAGRIIFVTIIPETGQCSFGGTSWLMEMEALTGNRLDLTPFDLNGDQLMNSADMTQLVDTNNDNVINASDTKLAASGKKSRVGIIKSPGVISAGEKEYKYTSGSTGALETTVESVESGAGRMSWRQLR
ncbi:PilC/PilY family type IV pilus protein [Methylomonas sp. SURF-2]|uniref:PilC/PilY family type IV pilus protein n=1 Tax=Methylomonas subterranea TaxID=2952225 RepID=A0ABT1TIB7_9GAMM|nr:PilC/PilY family type IV pilus protein [Methylomonas sp. SURF-2]MCQ8105216.1 PilC/PilY family type IV pilus protein [Methylomonas sp. SURF-2]